MVAVPAPTAVTCPLALTMATAVSLDCHVTLRFVAFAGVAVAVSCSVSPFTISRVETPAIVTPVTGTVTLTVTLALRLPSAVLTVMVVVPPALAVTSPLAFTVATAVLLEVHVTLRFVAFVGATVADNCRVCPIVKLRVEAPAIVTPVTGTVTLTVTLALRLPSAVLTVIVVVPPALA